MAILPGIVRRACTLAKCERDYTAKMKTMLLRLRVWGSGEVTDGTRKALTSMVDVWRHRAGDMDVVVSMRAAEWCSFVQRLAICVIQDDDAVIPHEETRRVRRMRAAVTCDCGCFS